MVLLILLLAATSGLAVSIYLLAVLYAPTESPLSVLYLILTRGVPQNLTFFIPLPSPLPGYRPRQHGRCDLLSRPTGGEGLLRTRPRKGGRRDGNEDTQARRE